MYNLRFFKIYLFYLSVCVRCPECIYVYYIYVCADTLRPEEDFGSPGTRAPEHHKAPDVCAGN